MNFAPREPLTPEEQDRRTRLTILFCLILGGASLLLLGATAQDTDFVPPIPNVRFWASWMGAVALVYGLKRYAYERKR